MERKLRYVSKEQYVKDITASAKSMQQFFNNKATKFNGNYIIFTSSVGG